ncbi:hypothetical protein ACROYT_G008727 [Oculina patagonica]
MNTNGSQLSQEMIPPACSMYISLGGMLPPSATEAKAFLIFLAGINIVTFPFTAVLNALVIIAVKTKARLRANKSNILLAFLATTDLMVGVIIQPLFAALMITFVLAVFVIILNSFLNPLIYSVRMRQFRVAFIELTCRTASIAKAEEIEMRVFGSPNAVVSVQSGERQEQDQQNAEQATVNNTNNNNNEMLSQQENHIELQNLNCTAAPQYAH